MEFSSPEYWSEETFPSPGDLSKPRDRNQVSRIAGRTITANTVRFLGGGGGGGGAVATKSCPTLATPWTVAHQAPLSMGFSR